MRSIAISSSYDFIEPRRVAAPRFLKRNFVRASLFLSLLSPFVFVLVAVVCLDGVNNCPSPGTVILRVPYCHDSSIMLSIFMIEPVCHSDQGFLVMLIRQGLVVSSLSLDISEGFHDMPKLSGDLYRTLNQVNEEEISNETDPSDSFSQLVSNSKSRQYDSRTFAIMLRAMIGRLEREVVKASAEASTHKHVAASSIPRGLHCLSLCLTDEYMSNTHARKQLPSPELLHFLSDNSYQHFVLSTDNSLAASVVVASAVQPSLKPEKIVFHVITDKKTYAGMHSWFALNHISPAIVEVKGIHQFKWLMRENVPVLEAVESNRGIRNYYHGNHISGANLKETTQQDLYQKLRARRPKYISLLNHIRMYLPEMMML